MVVDEFWDGTEIVLLRQVKLLLCGGADIIMSAASTSFPNGRKGKVALAAAFSIFHVCLNIFLALFTTILLKPAMKKFEKAVWSRFCMNNLHLSPSVALCFRFHYKQFFF